jgi:putative ABC transport system permease protein
MGVAAGDSVLLRVLDGERRAERVEIAGLIDELVGLQGYLRLPALNRLLREGPGVSGALLAVDRGAEVQVIRRLNRQPGVAGVTSRGGVVARLEEQSGESMAVVTLVLTIFAVTIAVGVVYNNARVALSMRGRDFASLRVLGFTRGEIFRTLVAELAAQVVLAIPVGLVMGTWFTALVLSTAHPERYRFPVAISSRTYAFATLVIVASAALSALLVRRRLDRLDLIGVLKTRE